MPDDSLDSGISGLYRDGDMLVATIRDAQFPDRCIVTNQPTLRPKFRLREKMARADRGFFASDSTTATLIAAAFQAGSMKTVILEIG